MTTLITSGSGYFGSILLEQLRKSLTALVMVTSSSQQKD
jgi:hypothetical protein